MSTPEPNAARSPRGNRHSQRVWNALLAAARLTKRQGPLDDGSAYSADASGGLFAVPADDRRAWIIWQAPAGWIPAPGAPPAAHALLELYLPVCSASRASPLTVGHLGQGLDGYIATSAGDSNYVTGPQNILHLHRMRALCDAVLVGAETAAMDDPRLTARRADGENPVRVVLDPHCRLAPTLNVLSDREAPTLLVCDAAQVAQAPPRTASAEILGVALQAGRLDLVSLLEALHGRGLVSVFVEGGGSTVSGFLEAGLLDRLQIAIAPLITGHGRPGIRVLARQHIEECLRPPHRIFSMGEDILFDCDLRGAARGAEQAPAAPGGLRRVF